MERFVLNTDIRNTYGKGHARSLRRQDIIPCVVYRKGETQLIQINKKELIKFINSTFNAQLLANLSFPDGKSKLALLKQYQVDPVKGDLLHTDFYEVSLEEKVKVSVIVNLIGIPVGVKRDGGNLRKGLREIEIECLPDNIPSHIDFDITSLEAGQSIHVRDLKLDESIKIITDIDSVLAGISIPSRSAEETTEESEEEQTEPEVAKKGKSEE